MDFKFTVEGLRVDGGFSLADLAAIVDAVRDRRQAVGFYFSTKTARGLLLGVNMFLLTDDNPGQAFVLNPVDKKGNPAPVDSLKWSVSDPALLNLAVSTDGTQATLTAVGRLGTAQLNVTCQPQGDEDPAKTLSGSLSIQVVAGAAATITITPAAPANPTPAPVPPTPQP